ncbi:MAG: lactamase [Chloroflexi bacterium]|nr:lactamase [Chloroflexota bacterium]
MKVKLLGAHNFESRHTRMSSVLIDDTLVLDAGSITSTLPFTAQQRLKAVLLTHQHYDHTRDILTLAMNMYLLGSAICIYATSPVYQALKSHLLDGELYPNFLEYPEGNPAIKFNILEPLKPQQIEGYSVLAVPVAHSVPAIGYQITSPDGRALFYTGDTGFGLEECWEHVSPQLLVIELTVPNSLDDFARESGHLSPNLLKQELITFRKLKGYLPRVVTVHMNPMLEEEIKGEVAAVARDLDNSIILGSEDMELDL